MTSRRPLYVLIIILVAGISGLLGAVIGGIAVYTIVQNNLPRAQDASDTAITSSSSIQISSSQIETTITQSVEKIGPTVVTVLATVPGRMTFFGMTPDQQVTGSGVLISENGYFLTNNHVVENTIDVSVILANGSLIPVQIVGIELYADLAVLKIDGDVPAVAVLGNSDTLKPGETVIAIGSPLGDFKNSVTVGVVSATGRMIDTGKGYQMEDLIQTDAAINQGNSGGPLVNLAGEVIGINTLVVRGSGVGSDIAEGLGFAIPSNTAIAVADQIIEHGYFSRPYLGIRWQPITPRIAAAYRLPVEWGVFVTEVIPNSPAEQNGLRRGDIITSIGEVKLDKDHNYYNVLFSFSPGEMIIMEVVRGTRVLDIPVTFGETKS